MVTFLRAKMDQWWAVQRQRYLDEFFESHPSAAITEVIYNDPAGRFMDWAEENILGPLEKALGREKAKKERIKLEHEVEERLMPFMFIQRPYDAHLGDGRPSTVFVNAGSFSGLTEEGFEVALGVHEYTHCEDYQKGLDIGGLVLKQEHESRINRALFRMVLETRAWSKELAVFRKRKRPMFTGKSFEEGYKLSVDTMRENWLEPLQRYGTYWPDNERITKLEKQLKAYTLAHFSVG